MKKISFNNFYEETYANFQRIKESDIPKREPDYKSDSGSQYWYLNDSVIRVSNHWGRGISTCTWLLQGESSFRGVQCGICKLIDFKRSNVEILEKGETYKVKKVVLKRKGKGKIYIENKIGKFIRFTSDYYVFDQFKVSYKTLATVEKYSKPILNKKCA